MLRQSQVWVRLRHSRTLQALGLLLLVSAFALGDDAWRTHWTLGCGVLLLIFAGAVWRDLGALPALCLVYLGSTYLQVLGNPNGLPDADRYFPTYGYLALLLIAAAVLALKRSRSLEAVLGALGWLALLDSVLVIAQSALGHTWSGGLLRNPSMNGSWIAVCWPLARDALRHSPLPRAAKLGLGALPFLAIVLSLASVPYLCLLAVLGVTALSGLPGWPARLLLGGGAVALLAVGLWTQGTELYSSSDRFEAYSLYLGWWWEHADRELLTAGWWDHLERIPASAPLGRLFGTGGGTFVALGPAIQQLAGFQPQGGRWLWMHSDVLQILFEQGVLGLGLVIACYARSLLGLLRAGRHDCLAALAGYAVLATFNFPVRLALTSFTGALLLAVGLAARTRPRRYDDRSGSERGHPGCVDGHP